MLYQMALSLINSGRNPFLVIRRWTFKGLDLWFIDSPLLKERSLGELFVIG